MVQSLHASSFHEWTINCPKIGWKRLLRLNFWWIAWKIVVQIVRLSIRDSNELFKIISPFFHASSCIIWIIWRVLFLLSPSALSDISFHSFIIHFKGKIIIENWKQIITITCNRWFIILCKLQLINLIHFNWINWF